MEDERSKALRLIELKGPIIPVNISKDIGKNILFTSVILSELVRSKKLNISTLKIGGSPLYYLPHQKQRLENFYRYLNEKDRRTFDKLKKWQVLRDKEEDPLTKVSLKNIKDFAIPLEVSINGQKEIFWKWHTLSNEDASQKIKQILSKNIIKEENILEQKVPDEKQEQIINNQEKDVINENKKVELDKENNDSGKTEEQGLKEEKQTELKENEPIKEEKTTKSEPEKDKNQDKDPVKQELKEKDNILPQQEEKKEEEDFETRKDESNLEGNDDPFYKKIKDYFDKNDIEIKWYEITRKKSEIDFIVHLGSKIGKLKYFCRAKNKKRISDSDVASAFVQSQVKKLPLLFVTTGTPTKKTKEMMEKEFDSVVLLEI